MSEVVTLNDALEPGLIEMARAELAACERKTPDAAALATLASLARSIEPELLRTLRVDLGPRLSGARISVSAESALWFSNLVESRGAGSITLLPEVLHLLRPRLAKDRPLLNDARKIVAECHSSAPEVLQWEEEIVYLALTGQTTLLEQEVLRGLRGISQGPRQPLVNWIADMWLRLPPEARSNPLLSKLHQVATGLARRRTQTVSGGPTSAADLVLDFSTFPKRQLGVVLQNDHFVFGDLPDAEFGIEVPDLEPVELDVLAPSTVATTQPIKIAWGSSAMLATTKEAVTVRTVSGQIHRLEPDLFRPPPPAQLPSVYICYSHEDKDMLPALMANLKTLEQAGLVDVWADTRIDAGAEWYSEIEAAMKQAAVAVCLISEFFLASDFCIKQEVPFLLKRAAENGLLIVPVLLSDCVWEAHRWLREMQMMPGDGKTVRRDFAQNPGAVFARVAKRIYEKLDDPRYETPVAAPVWPPISPELIDRTHLPETDLALFGRDDQLALLDQAWQSTDHTSVNSTNILVFTAYGGVGKSTLVNHWLNEMARDNYRGATRVFGWSFYSQGRREATTASASADVFLDTALRFFGDTDPTAGSSWEKGQRLSYLVGQERSLLVLDGLERFQSRHEFERGKIQDPALDALLRGLTRHSTGLCIITTRQPLVDLTGAAKVVTHDLDQSGDRSAHDLEQISPQAGRAMLRTARVVGTDAELEELARDFGLHALAISLLGAYLSAQPGRGLEAAKALKDLPGEKPIDRVLEGIEKLLGDSPEREALRLVGFFDRPADEKSLGVLRTPPVVSGLNGHLTSLSNIDWDQVIDSLIHLGLVSLQEDQSGGRLVDSHPLIRQHFAQSLNGSEAWREGHRRLYEFLYETTAEGDRPTLEDLQPLCQAVAHGSQAGLTQQAFDDVYVARLQQGNKNYLGRELGAFNTDLGVIATFFERPWSDIKPELTNQAQAYLLNRAAYDLRSLGRLTEALEPMREAVKMLAAAEDWSNATSSLANLSELELTLGNVAEAQSEAEQSLTYADRSGSRFHRMITSTTLANALHQGAHLSEAEMLFRDAEQLQQEGEPEHPLLYSVQGFQYCDLLLQAAERAAWQTILQLKPRNSELESLETVFRRASETLNWATDNQSLLYPVLDRLTLGRARLYATMLEPARAEFRTSTVELNGVVEGLRRAGIQDYLSRALMVRAWGRFLAGSRTGSESAQEDLDEAWQLAERGPMRLFMADIHLYRAALFHNVKPYPWDKNPDGSPRGPKDDLAAARKLIEQCGYWRRKEELEDAEEAAKSW